MHKLLVQVCRAIRFVHGMAIEVVEQVPQRGAHRVAIGQSQGDSVLRGVLRLGARRLPGQNESSYTTIPGRGGHGIS